MVSGKNLQQLVNEVDGARNLKGSVFSKNQIRDLLGGFKDLEVFVGALQSWMILPKGFRFIPNRFLKRFEKYLGWFLYVKGFKP